MKVLGLMPEKPAEFHIAQLKLCNRTRHAYEVKQKPNKK